MPPDPATVSNTVPLGYLIVAISTEAAVIAALFGLLLSTKSEVQSVLREILPVVTSLTKLLERLERKEGP